MPSPLGSFLTTLKTDYTTISKHNQRSSYQEEQQFSKQVLYDSPHNDQHHKPFKKYQTHNAQQNETHVPKGHRSHL